MARFRRVRNPKARRGVSGFSLSPMMIAVLGVGAFIVYQIFKSRSGVAGAATLQQLPPSGTATVTPIQSTLVSAPQPLPGSMAATSGQLSTAASFWQSLTPVQPIPNGYINFPSGAQAAAAAFGYGNTAMDSAGNYYVLWGGQVFELGSMDANGNWPATLAA